MTVLGVGCSRLVVFVPPLFFLFYSYIGQSVMWNYQGKREFTSLHRLGLLMNTAVMQNPEEKGHVYA